VLLAERVETLRISGPPSIITPDKIFTARLRKRIDRVLTCGPQAIEIRISVMLRGGVMEDFYRGLAQQARDLAEKADPFTRRRLLDLAQRYDLKSKPGAAIGRPIPPQRATPLTVLFSGSGEAEELATPAPDAELPGASPAVSPNGRPPARLLERSLRLGGTMPTPPSR
jgi:hypothetical protein